MKFPVLLPAALTAAALAGCNSASQPAAFPTLGPTCALPSGVQTALVYPAPGAAGVVDGNGQIVVGSTTALPSNYDISITDALNPNYLNSPALASTNPPFPSPNQTPSFPNPQYQTTSYGVPFQSGQTVTVYINDASSNCTPLRIGSFST